MYPYGLLLAGRDNPAVLIRHVVGGNRPDVARLAATGVPQAVTDLIVRCWDAAPRARPPMEEVIATLEEQVALLP
jgi:hypothetical protein